MPTLRADRFYIEIDYLKDSENPERVFKALSNLIESYNTAADNLLSTVSLNVQTRLILSDVEIGSVRVWLANQLKSINEDDIQDLKLKRILGTFINKGVKTLIKSLDRGEAITSSKSIGEVQTEITELARQTEINQNLIFTPISPQLIYQNLYIINKAIFGLAPEDKAIFGHGDDTTPIKHNKYLADSEIQDVLGVNSRHIENDMVLRIKKPDYLGTSQWEFKFGNRTITEKNGTKNGLINFIPGKFHCSRAILSGPE